MNATALVITESSLSHGTQELIKLRASQINGCGYCTDMHAKDALHAGVGLNRPGEEAPSSSTSSPSRSA